MLKLIAHFVLYLFPKIDVALCDLNNATRTVKIQPMLPHQYFQLFPRAFYELIQEHQPRL